MIRERAPIIKPRQSALPFPHSRLAGGWWVVGPNQKEKGAMRKLKGRPANEEERCTSSLVGG